MKLKPKTNSNLPRAEVLAALDRAYDRVCIAQNDAEFIDAVGNLAKLAGELPL